MEVHTTVAELQGFVAGARRAGEAIALVPTMGALHAGHMALVEEGKRRAPRVLVSIFVNPLQFEEPADLENYPRDLEADLALLERGGAVAAFVPSPQVMYPAGFATAVEVSGLTEVLEGAARPGHFRGVATVVTRLLNLCGAEIALFGLKDYQQFRVVCRLAEDLGLAVELVGVPTVREDDGLAISSRNQRLSAAGRTVAALIPEALSAARSLRAEGESAAYSLTAAASLILMSNPQLEPEYVSVNDHESLMAVSHCEQGERIFVAAQVEGVRVIDNMPLLGEDTTLVSRPLGARGV